ncbi:hypothetical protein BLA60_38820 [Actinophytocola xinjiangensis]|uniref:DUF485 domain-containing protein n=1 Tax=Actinophytocola xinjiangensis TaxID=485602 RepID=A0A7Z1ATL6_9PSEU|nr:hypothetical protein BLA60_38820 [Actinophytocola xinjiangensis]
MASRSTTPGNDFGGITRQPAHGSGGPPNRHGAPDFVAIQESAEFAALRRRFRLFVFPVSALFFLWYLTYVLLAAFARDFMSHQLFGSINVGLALGVLQFVTTVAITFGYVRYARRRLDPSAAAIRAEAGR